jgi:hypothetical protein
MLPEGDDSDEDAVAILDQVELRRFTATPGSIVPFEASLLEWEVTGEGAFAVLLDNLTVHRSGEKLVTPLSTRTFHLKARVRNVTQELGTLTIAVDGAACRDVIIPNIIVRQAVQEDIDALLLTMPGVSRRKPDVVTVDETGIGIRLALKKVVPHFPNPDVDVDAHWTYRVANGDLFAFFDKLDVDVTFPWWVWTLPFAYPGLPIAISMAKDDTRSKVVKKAEGGGERLELAVPGGFRILSAKFTVTNFEMRACPDQALRKLVPAGATISVATKRR